MANEKLEQMAIPKFPNDAAEAEWWDAHRAEVEGRVLAKLGDLAGRTAADINERVAKMSPRKLARADSEIKKLADRVRRRAP